MFEVLRRKIGHEIHKFRRDWLNQGYVEYLIESDKRRKLEFKGIEAQVEEIGSIATRFVEPRFLSDDELILRDQLYEHNRGRIVEALGNLSLEEVQHIELQRF